MVWKERKGNLTPTCHAGVFWHLMEFHSSMCQRSQIQALLERYYIQNILSAVG